FQVGQTLFNVFFSLVLLGSEIHALIERIQHERDTDALTRLHNRRSFEELARATIS
ncbi:MAG TPA: GGDEF domain-containing protein, partial [Cupriavidus sp.]|nr:GGDEF domain-containing protein [Cupriavidus sp.]